MRGKRGFTLTEILGVLVIMGLLLLLIVPTIINKVRDSEKDTKKIQDKMIEESTNLYMDDNKDLFPSTTDNVYCIPVQTLIDHGKITEDLKDVTSKDPNIKKRIMKVTISETKERIFESVNSCNQIQYKNIIFTVGPKDNSEWTTSKYATIRYPNMGEGYTNKYSIDNGRTWKIVVGNVKKTEDYTANGKVMARMEGPTIIKDEYPVKRIDRAAPTITSVSGNPTNWTKNNATLTINGAKDTGSGLAAKAYSFDNGATWQSSNKKEYSSNTSNIIIKVRDALGNTYTHPTINITKIDKIAPTITNVIGNPTTWTKNNVTLTVNGARDTGSGLAPLAYSFDGGTTWQSSNKKIYTANKNNISIKVRDAIGNIYTYRNINITKIDKVAPTITGVSGNPTTWTRNNVILSVNGARDTGSGISYFGYSFDGGVTWQIGNQRTYLGNANNISIKVRDDVGNTYTYPNINITKIDKVAPTCGTVINSSSKWRNTAQTITQYCSDSGSKCARGSYSTKYYNNTTSGVYIYDNAGNKSYCTYGVYVDTTAPYSPYYPNGMSPTITVVSGTAETKVKGWSCSQNLPKTRNMNQCTVNYLYRCKTAGGDGRCWASFSPKGYSFNYEDNLSPLSWQTRLYEYGSGCKNGLLTQWSFDGLSGSSCVKDRSIYEYRLIDGAGNAGGVLRVTNNFEH